jgi:hypothetical protein
MCAAFLFCQWIAAPAATTVAILLPQESRFTQLNAILQIGDKTS